MPPVDIENLTVSFPQHQGVVQAVRGMTLRLNPGESLGIVGESGSGKSVTCMAVMRLLREPPARILADKLHLGRLISVALTCTVVSVIVFLMMHAVPGGPFDGNDMPVNDAVKAKLNASLGRDKPLDIQYFKYMWGVLHFDFGVPFQSPGKTVLHLLARAWPPSLTVPVFVISMMLIMVFAVWLGWLPAAC